MDFFDRVINWHRTDDTSFEGIVPDAWLQGRTAFGGLISAIGVRAMRCTLGEDTPLLTVETAFLGPIAGGGPASVSVAILRKGRHVIHVEARMTQGGEERARVSGVFGNARPSKITVAHPPGKPAAKLEDSFALPFLPGVTPAFVENFDMRWTEGVFPFTGAKEAVVGGYCRHRNASGGIEALVALADVWPAPVLPLLDRPAPASSVRWTLHIVGDIPADPRAWFWSRSETITAGGGYATMTMHLHGPDLSLVAWGEQLVAVFDG